MARTSNDPTDVFKFYDMAEGDQCWAWLGPWGGREREKRPYFMAAGRRMIAYRWVYELTEGIILAPDQPILHSCDQGGWPCGCGQPAHLRMGTHVENMTDMKLRERHGLPHSVIHAIRNLLAMNRPQHEIATLYGISRETISAIATGRVYGHITDGGEN